MICPMKLVTERESTIDADTAIDILGLHHPPSSELWS